MTSPYYGVASRKINENRSTLTTRVTFLPDFTLFQLKNEAKWVEEVMEVVEGEEEEENVEEEDKKGGENKKTRKKS